MPHKEYPDTVSASAKLKGFKTANLEELSKLLGDTEGVSVPGFYGISSDDIKKHLKGCDWQGLWVEFCKIQGDNDTISPEAEEILNRLQGAIKSAFSNKRFDLGGDKVSGRRVMVRSTGFEDRVDVANAGGNESLASKNNPNDISESIAEVIGSYFSVKSLSQRLKLGENITESEPLMACLVQTLVGEGLNGEKGTPSIPISGVIYTDGRGGIRVQAAPGHGELVVNSKGHFDNYYIKEDGSIYTAVGNKKVRLVPTLNEETGKISLEEQENDFEQQTSKSLSDSVLIRIKKAVEKIEIHYGMRMDIEFVYDSQTDTINIVQARAIPEGSRKGKTPSALDPDFIAEKKGYERYKGTIVTPDILTAAVLDSSDKVLVFDSIKTALDYYLSLNNPIIEAVIIKDPSPDTSHEAGMFTSKAIPVIQLNDEEYSKVSEWKKKTGNKGQLVLDTQHGSVFELEEGVVPQIKEGIFRSTLTEQVTPKKVQDKSHEEWMRALEVLQPILGDEKTNHPLDLGPNPWKQILDDIDALAFINADQIEAQNESIKNLLALVFRLIEKKYISQEVFQTIAIAFSDFLIERERYLEEVDPEEKEISRLRYLDVHKKIEGLFDSRAVKGVLSSSVIREITKATRLKKCLDKYKDSWPTPEGLSGRELEFYHELVVMESSIADESKRYRWVKFCNDVAEMKSGKSLGLLVKHLRKFNVDQYWINTDFLEEDSKGAKGLLRRLAGNLSSVEVMERQSELGLAQDIIERMERRIESFSSSKDFDKLFAEFEKNLQILNKILTKEDINHLNAQIAAKLDMKLVDIIDLTIKSLWQSSDYSKEQKPQQVKNYGKMVALFVSQVESYLLHGEKTLGWNRISEKKNYSDIKKKLEELLKKEDEQQLDISKDFSVLSTLVNIDPDEIELGLEEVKTLADMHSVAHQNRVMQSARRLKPLNKSIENRLPADVKAAIEMFKQQSVGAEPDLVGIDLEMPIIRLNYNIPLRQHSATCTLEYDTTTKKFTLSGQFYGLYEAKEGLGRWQSIAGLLVSEFLKQNVLVRHCEGHMATGNFEVVCPPEKLQAVIDSFFKAGKETLSLSSSLDDAMKSLAGVTSKSFVDLCTAENGSFILGHDAKTVYLQPEKKDLIKQRIDIELGETDKATFLKNSYNGLALYHLGVLNKELVENTSLERIKILCSPGFMYAYSKFRIHDKLLAIEDDEKLKLLTSENATRCYRFIGFDDMQQIREEASSDDLKLFNFYTSDNAFLLYKHGMSFNFLKEEVAKLGVDEVEKSFKMLLSHKCRSLYKAGVQFDSLYSLWREGEIKFQKYTSSKIAYCCENGVKFSEICEIEEEDEFEYLTSKPLSLLYSQGLELSTLRELYSKNILKPVFAIYEAANISARRIRRNNPAFQDLVSLYGKGSKEELDKFNFLTSGSFLQCYKSGVSFEEILQIFDRLNDKNAPIFSLISSDNAIEAYKAGIKLSDITDLYGDGSAENVERLNLLLSPGSISCLKSGVDLSALKELTNDANQFIKVVSASSHIGIAQAKELYKLGEERFELLTSDDTYECYREGIRYDVLIELSKDNLKFNAIVPVLHRVYPTVSLAKLVELYGQGTHDDKKKLNLLTSHNARKCYLDGSITLQDLEELYGEGTEEQIKRFNDIVNVCSRNSTIPLSTLKEFYGEYFPERFADLTSEAAQKYFRFKKNYTDLLSKYDGNPEKYKTILEAYAQSGIYRRIDFAVIEDLYGTEQDPSEKFTALTSERAVKCLKLGVKFNELTRLYDVFSENIDGFYAILNAYSKLPKVGKSLRSKEPAIPFQDLVELYESDVAKFDFFTSEGIIKLYKLGVSFEDITKAYNRGEPYSKISLDRLYDFANPLYSVSTNDDKKVSKILDATIKLAYEEKKYRNYCYHDNVENFNNKDNYRLDCHKDKLDKALKNFEGCFDTQEGIIFVGSTRIHKKSTDIPKQCGGASTDLYKFYYDCSTALKRLDSHLEDLRKAI